MSQSSAAHELYLITQRQTALTFADIPRKAGSVVATSSWQIEQILRRAGHDVSQLEHRVSPELADEADRFLYAVVRGWYLHNGTDFTESGGISLGKVHEYEHIHCQVYPTEAFTATHGVAGFVKGVMLFRTLLDECRPATVYHDLGKSAVLDALNLVASEQGIRVQALPTLQAPGPFAATVAAARAGSAAVARRVVRWLRGKWLRWVGRGQTRGGRGAVAVTGYPPLRAASERLRAEGYHIHDPWQSIQGFSLSRAVARDIKFEHQRLVERWARVSSDPAYQARFCFLGVNCFPFFRAFFTTTVEGAFPQTLRQAAALTDFYRRCHIAALVVPFDEPNFPRLCVLVARRSNILTLVLQHGLFAYAHVGHKELMTADHVCVIGDSDATEVSQRRPKAQLHVVGCVQLDQYAAPPPEARAPLPRPAENPLRILVLTFAIASSTAHCRASDPEVYLEQAIRALDRFRERVEVTLKLHPSEKSARYREALRLIEPRVSCSIESGWTLPDLLPQYDLVIAPVSTGVAEALSLRKPVIFFHTHRGPVPAAFDEGGGLLTARDPDQLAVCVRSAVDDYQSFLSKYDFASPLRLMGPQDGRASVRLEAVIKDAISSQLRKGCAV